MSVNQTGGTYQRNLDLNEDGVVNHADVEEYFKELDATNAKGNPRFLLALQKAGGEVTAQDWLNLIDEGAYVSGDHISKWVEAGGKLTAGELKALQDKGVKFTDKELEAIETKCGIPPSSSFPPGTTVKEVLDMAEAGVKVRARDLIHLKNADGSPVFVDIKDLEKLQKLGIKVTGADLIAFKKMGGYVDGDNLVNLVNNGADFTEAEIVELANLGCKIWQDDLKTISEACNLQFTIEQYRAIKPIKPDGTVSTGDTTPDGQSEGQKQAQNELRYRT